MPNWIQLASGGGYSFDDAKITGPFSVESDIAWPLSALNRFVGHTTRLWNVALHSVAVARTILRVTGDSDAAAAGLMHELHEAVIGDIPTPVAWELGYDRVKQLKHTVQAAIYWRLHTPAQMRPEAHHDVVEQADHAALYVEKQMFMVPEPQQWSVGVPEHEWMLAMYHEMQRLLREVEEIPAHALFMIEWRRLVQGQDVRIIHPGEEGHPDNKAG